MSLYKTYLFILVGFWLGLLLPAPLSAQEKTTFFPDIFPIVSQKCSPCHHESGVAPFPLLSYADFKSKGRFIKAVTESRYMPPWPADPAYRHFGNEIRLSDEEIQAIGKWVAEGMEKGKKSGNEERFELRGPKTPPDTVLGMPEAFKVPGDGKDHFAYFLLPDTLKSELYVREFQFMPGNKRVVHHMELMLARPGVFPGVEGRVLTERDYYGTDFMARFGSVFEYVAGWLPGNEGEQYPEHTGMHLPRGSRLILMIHYGPSPVEEEDLSRLGVYLGTAAPKHLIESIDLHGESDMVDGPLFLQAGELRTFHSYKLLEEDFEAFAVFPHAHHLCTSMRAFAILPTADTIPLLSIPKWDFDWQFTYYFPSYLHLPKGTEVHFFATYDNRAENPENPYQPPRDIRSSFRANDEMMELFLWGIKADPDSLPELEFRWR